MQETNSHRSKQRFTAYRTEFYNGNLLLDFKSCLNFVSINGFFTQDSTESMLE